MSQKVRPADFKQLNQIIAAVYGLQAVLILLVAKSYMVPVTARYLTTDTLASRGGEVVLAQASRQLYEVNLRFLLGGLLLAAALIHFLIATRWRQRYEAGLQKRFNMIGWISLSVAAAPLLVVVGLVNGIYDKSSLVLIAGLTVAVSQLGWLSELHNQVTRRVSWVGFWSAFAVAALLWTAILFYTKDALIYGDRALPGVIYGVNAVGILGFAAMAINQWLQLKKRGKWRDYLYAERNYLIITTVAATLIAVQIFFGSLRG